MNKSRLPNEAFEFYCGLGDDRSYDAVAKHYGVSKRAVARRAASDRWQQRIAALVSGARAGSTEAMQRELEEAELGSTSRTKAIQDAIFEVLTPQRVKALFASAFKTALQTSDVAIIKFLLERVLGRPRNEPLLASALDLPDGLSTTRQVREAANTILQGVAAGKVAPEDAQRAVSVVEAARRTIESQDLEARIAAIEDEVRKDKNR